MFSPQNELKSVLYLRLSPAVDEAGDLSPFVAHIQPLLEEIDVLIQAPLLLVNGGVQGCKPSLTALLAVTGCVCHLVLV